MRHIHAVGIRFSGMALLAFLLSMEIGCGGGGGEGGGVGAEEPAILEGDEEIPEAMGVLDETFNGTGKVTTAIGWRDEAHAVALQSDGKIVAAGFSSDGQNRDFAVVRYNTDGTLDSGFGSGGTVITAIGPGQDEAHAVVLQMDGKIVVAGLSSDGQDRDFAVVRYEADGALDEGFGLGGTVKTEIGSIGDEAFAAAIQSDGKIVVAGATGVWPDVDFAVVRYAADGTLDDDFGASHSGMVRTNLGSSTSRDDYAYAVALQSDGKIVVAGSSCNGQNDDFAVVRYRADGALDESFNGTGKVTAQTAIGSWDDRARAVAVHSDGRIVVAGYSSNGSNQDYAVVRYHPNGSLDETFGSNGIARTAFGPGNDHGLAMVLQSNGKILVAGSASEGSSSDFGIVRYTMDGAMDASFGSAGKVTTPIGPSWDHGHAVALQSDGRIVVAGRSYNGTSHTIAVVRYK